MPMQAHEIEELLRETFPHKSLPPHFGFQRAASLLEQQGAYKRAIEICKRAERQGWRSGSANSSGVLSTLV
mgnify:CR=1 FL=1